MRKGSSQKNMTDAPPLQALMRTWPRGKAPEGYTKRETLVVKTAEAILVKPLSQILFTASRVRPQVRPLPFSSASPARRKPAWKDMGRPVNYPITETLPG
jgi:hypothetical protein